MRLDESLINRLVAMSVVTGLSKTVIATRALEDVLDAFELDGSIPLRVAADAGQEPEAKSVCNAGESLYGEVELNPHGVNRKIGYHILDEDAMVEAGFRQVGDDRRWIFVKDIVRRHDIALYVSFPDGIEDNDSLRIDIIDEAFGQPYDYQTMLNIAMQECHEPNPVAVEVEEAVERELERLQTAGILYGHVRGEYV